MGFPDSVQCQNARYRAAKAILQILAGTSTTQGLYDQMSAIYSMGSELQTNLTSWNSSVKAEMGSVFGTSTSVGDLLRETSHNMYHDAEILFETLQQFDPILTNLSQSATTVQQGMESAWVTDYSAVISALTNLNATLSTAMATNIDNLNTAYAQNLLLLNNAATAMQTQMSTQRAAMLAAANANITAGMLQLNTANASRDTIISINNTLATMGSNLTGFANTLLQIISTSLTTPMQTEEVGYTADLTGKINTAVTTADGLLGSAGTVSQGYYTQESTAITNAATAFSTMMTPVWQMLSSNVTSLATQTNATSAGAVGLANETAARLAGDWNQTMTMVNTTRQKDLAASSGIATTISNLKTDADTWYSTAQSQYNTLSQQISQTESDLITALQSQSGGSANSIFQNILWVIGNVTHAKQELLEKAKVDGAALQAQIAALAASMGVSTQTFQDAFISMQGEVATLSGMLNSSALDLTQPINTMAADFESQLETAETDAKLTAINLQNQLDAAQTSATNSSANLISNATEAAIAIRVEAQTSDTVVSNRAVALQSATAATANDVSTMQTLTVGNLSLAQKTLTALNSALPASKTSTLQLITSTSDHVAEVAASAQTTLSNFAKHVTDTLSANSDKLLADAGSDFQKVSTTINNQISQDAGLLTDDYAPLKAMLSSFQQATSTLAGKIQPLDDAVNSAATSANGTIAASLQETLKTLEAYSKAAAADLSGETAKFATNLGTAARTVLDSIDPAIAAVVKPANDLGTSAQAALGTNAEKRLMLKNKLDGLDATLNSIISEVNGNSDVSLGTLSDTFEGATHLNTTNAVDYGLLTGMQAMLNASQYSAIQQANDTATRAIDGIVREGNTAARNAVDAFRVSMAQLSNTLGELYLEVASGQDGFPAASLKQELSDTSKDLHDDIQVAMTTQSRAVRDELVLPIAGLADNMRQALEYQLDSANSVGSRILSIAGGSGEALNAAAETAKEAIATGSASLAASQASAEKSASDMESSNAESAESARDLVAGLKDTLNANADAQEGAHQASAAAAAGLSGTIQSTKASMLSGLTSLNNVLTKSTLSAASATASISQDVPMQARAKLASDANAWESASKASLASISDTESHVESLSSLFKSMFASSISKSSHQINDALTALSAKMRTLESVTKNLGRMSATVGSAQDQAHVVHSVIKDLATNITSQLKEATDAAVEAVKDEIAQDISTATSSLATQRSQIYKLISSAR